jgi:hypothetical protein
MAYTKAQWDALQRRFPPAERESYESYLALQNIKPATNVNTPSNTSANDASREALRVLTSGGTLTNEQRAILGLAREAGASGATGSGIVGGEFFGGAGGSGAAVTIFWRLLSS